MIQILILAFWMAGIAISYTHGSIRTPIISLIIGTAIIIIAILTGEKMITGFCLTILTGLVWVKNRTKTH